MGKRVLNLFYSVKYDSRKGHKRAVDQKEEGSCLLNHHVAEYKFLKWAWIKWRREAIKDQRFTEGMEREEYAYKTPKSSQFLESMSEADMLCLLREWKADVVFRIDEAVGDFLCLVDLNMHVTTILGFSTEHMSPTKTRTESFLGGTSGLYDWWGGPMVH